jgi:hypothetical protein
MGFQKGNTLGQKFGRDKDPRTGQEKTTEALRKKKTLRERLLLLAETPVENSRGEKMASEDVIAVQLRNKAAKGDLKAIRLYAELTGQLTQQIEVNPGERPLQIYEWQKAIKK